MKMSASIGFSSLSVAVLVATLAACGGGGSGPSYEEFARTRAPKLEALKKNLARAVAAATAPDAASAPTDCSPLHLTLNGKKQVGNAEVFWADELDLLLAGKRTDVNEDKHLVPQFLVAGWCQRLVNTMYWLGLDKANASDMFNGGVGKAGADMDSALGLTYALVMVPGTHVRGEQKVSVRAVELATGTVKCGVEIAGHADPSLGTEYYQLVRSDTREAVGGVQARDGYAMAMRADLAAEVGNGLSKAMNVDMQAYCPSAGE